MSAFVPRAVASTLAEPDPSKHVNYTLGMVLGVDDFKQEFAYLSGRAQWLGRDLFGYGTASGLQVNIEVEGNAPQVVVTPGVAVSPRGQSIRVSPAQCADLDTWLTTHREELGKRLGEVKVNTAETRLYVTLCYRECKTDMVPIPGEPCRSADETLAASRVTDDFKLELRFDPPAQREEDALREYAEWLGQIEIKSESSETPKLQEFEDAIRKMVRDQSQAKGSTSLMTGPPPADLKIEAKHTAKYLRTALNFWVTELRSKLQSWRPEVGSGLDAKTADKVEECVLLAEVRVPLKRASTTAVWRAGEVKNIQVLEDRRPVVAHARMLQELLLGVGRVASVKPPAYQTMAAGLVKGAEGSGGNEFNNLRVTKTGAGFVSMTFDGYEQPDPATAPFQYIVKALVVLPSGSTLTQTVVTFLRFEAAETGFTLGVTNAGRAVDKAALANLSFMVEVSRYATAGKDNKETKEKDAKETKDTKETKEKDTKETKEKDTKESKDSKDTKEKDTKETKEKDTKETKDTKDTKELSKDTKEIKEGKENKEAKEAKEEKE
ncbi:MAG TPA: DNA-directed RNA polymerase I subunit RPA34, partial [Pyrinomonadaceae bacterium]